MKKIGSTKYTIKYLNKRFAKISHLLKAEAWSV